VTNAWLVPLLVLIVGMFMSVLDISIVNVAIPTIQKDFGASTDDIEWVTTAYTLALGIVVPLSGWLGDRFDMSRVYLFSLLGFAVSSALCGLAWNLNSMIVFRVLQAIPGGVIPVVSMSMVYAIVPPAKMGTAMGLFGLGIIFGPAIGPTLGGYLVEYVSWPLIFFINVPFGILGAAAAWFLLPPSGARSRRPMDWWGFLIIGPSLFVLLLACSEGQSWGWTSYKTMILMTAGVLGLALFVVVELEREHPLIDMRVFRSWMFTTSLLLITILTIGLFAILFYLPLFLQTTQGVQPLRTGLILLPEALTMAVIMPIAGRLYDLVGPRRPAVIGLVIAAIGGILLCGINPNMSEGDVILWTCIRAAGNGLAMMPIFTAGLAAIPPQYASSGSSVNNIVQRMASSLGLAAMGLLATHQQNQLMADRSALIPATPSLPAAQELVAQGRGGMLADYRQMQAQITADAYSNVFLVAAALTVAGIGLAFFMKKTEHPAPAAAAEPAPSHLGPEPGTELIRAPAVAIPPPATEPTPATSPARTTEPAGLVSPSGLPVSPAAGPPVPASAR
jgi:EmrB/QacA subfamily drug resistance transporter